MANDKAFLTQEIITSQWTKEGVGEIKEKCEWKDLNNGVMSFEVVNVRQYYRDLIKEYTSTLESLKNIPDLEPEFEDGDTFTCGDKTFTYNA